MENPQTLTVSPQSPAVQPNLAGLALTSPKNPSLFPMPHASSAPLLKNLVCAFTETICLKPFPDLVDGFSSLLEPYLFRRTYSSLQNYRFVNLLALFVSSLSGIRGSEVSEETTVDGNLETDLMDLLASKMRGAQFSSMNIVLRVELN